MKWRAAVSILVLASRALSEEVSGGLHDDILAMLQSSLRVKTNSNTTSLSNESETPGGPQMESVSHLEEMVLSKIRDGKLEGDAKLAGIINKSIKNMYTSIISTTASNQKLIVKSILAFKKCKVDMWSNYGKALPLEKKHWILKNIYPKCIRAENKLALDNRKVVATYKTAKNLYDNTKKLLQIKGKTCTNRCTNLRNENYHEQLQRLVKFYKDCKKKLGPLGEQLAKAKKTYQKEHKKHYITSAKYKAMLKKCKKIAYLQNWRKCQSVTKLQTGCKGYGACWKIALKNYNKNAAMVREQEKTMKIQWRTLKRIQCYLKVIDDKKQKNAKGKDMSNKEVLEGCIKMKRPDTKHLDIDYGKIPKKPKCPLDKMCPCTPFYVNTVYKIGPKTRCKSNMVKSYKCVACKAKQWKKAKKVAKAKAKPKKR